MDLLNRVALIRHGWIERIEMVVSNVSFSALPYLKKMFTVASQARSDIAFEVAITLGNGIRVKPLRIYELLVLFTVYM